MNIVLKVSQYAAVLTIFNSDIGRNFGGEAGVFGGNVLGGNLRPPVDRTLTMVYETSPWCVEHHHGTYSAHVTNIIKTPLATL